MKENSAENNGKNSHEFRVYRIRSIMLQNESMIIENIPYRVSLID